MSIPLQLSNRSLEEAKQADERSTLGAYSQLKLELAAIIRAGLEVARRRKDEDQAHFAERLLARSASGRGDAHNIIPQFREKVRDLERQREHLGRKVRQRIAHQLPPEIEGEMTAWCTEVSSEAQDDIDRFLQGGGLVKWPARVRDIKARLGSHVSESARTQVTTRRAAWESALRRLAENESHELRQLNREPSRFAAHLLGVHSPDEPWLSELDWARTIHFGIRDAAELSWPALGLWAYLPPLRPARPWLRRRWQASAQQALTLYCDQMRDGLRSAAWDWIDCLEREAQVRIEKAIARVEASLRGSAGVDETEQLTQLKQRVEAFRERVQQWHPRDHVSAPRAKTNLHIPEVVDDVASVAKAACVMCGQVGNALFDFLAKYQYDLATSESHQTAHAQASGFCPVHAWAYESIASARGVCLAYASVLELCGRRLKALAAHSSTLGNLTDGLMQLLPGPARCPACHDVAHTESHAARNLVAGWADGRGFEAPPLCLFHLQVILTAKPPIEIARALVESESKVLQRLSEDMRHYALKFDALRRHLMTKEEQRHTSAAWS
jgi:hypothetical protein